MTEYNIINDNGEGIYEVVSEKSDIHYYINEPKKTVVAVMRNCQDNFYSKLFEIIDPITGGGWLTTKSLIMSTANGLKETYKGKAKCIGGDSFDLSTGMRIAREHMLEKYYGDYFVACGAALNYLNKSISDLVEHTNIIYDRYEKFRIASAATRYAAENYKANN